jgi:hypothetical protein
VLLHGVVGSTPSGRSPDGQRLLIGITHLNDKFQALGSANRSSRLDPLLSVRPSNCQPQS